MKSNFARNFSQVVEEITSRGEKAVLGLDIFDTVLIRKVDKPADVFLLVEDNAAEKYGFSPGEFLNNRIRAEREARIYAANAGRAEVVLDEIYSMFAEITGVSKEAADYLKKVELDCETDVIDLRHDVLDVVTGLSEKIDSVYLVSDTYLPQSAIAGMLKKCKLNSYIKKYKLFLSCVEGKTKHDGQLLLHVLNKEGIDKNRFVYVGDNINSDVVNSNKSRVRSVHVPKISFAAKKSGLYFRNDSNFCAGAAMLQGRINTTVGTMKQHDPAQKAIETLGLSLAPLWLGFTDWLLRDIQRKSIENVFFLSRDGYVFHRLCSLVAPEYSPKYMCISREMLYKAYFYIDFKSACRLVPQNYTNHTLKEAIVRLFDNTELHETIFSRVARLGFAVEGEVSGQPDALDYIVGTFKNELAEQGKGRFDRYIGYLNGIGFFSKYKVAIVDLGWHGSLQRILKEIIDFAGARMEVNGYYLGLFKGAPQDSYNCYFSGYLCDRGLGEFDFESLIRESPSLIEVLHAAPHGSLADINSGGEPVLRRNDLSENGLKIVSVIQRVAFSTIISSAKVSGFKLIGFKASLTKQEAIHCLGKILSEPTEALVSVAANFVLSPDYGLDKTVSLVGIVDGNISTSHWKAGTLRLISSSMKRKGVIPSWFDEERYLSANVDVAKAVMERKFVSGYDHYIKIGKLENRKFA